MLKKFGVLLVVKNNVIVFVAADAVMVIALGTNKECFTQVGNGTDIITVRELKKMEARIKDKGYTVVPLRLFFNEKNLAKLEIGLGKGKKLHDKRDTIRQRDTEREMKRYIK